MYLEPVIQSEVNQKEKNKYCILQHTYEIQKMVLMNLFAGKEWRQRRREWICGHNGGGKSGTNGESSIDIYRISYLK